MGAPTPKPPLSVTWVPTFHFPGFLPPEGRQSLLGVNERGDGKVEEAWTGLWRPRAYWQGSEATVRCAGSRPHEARCDRCAPKGRSSCAQGTHSLAAEKDG